MSKYVKKPVEVEAITFEELVRIGAENADTVVDGMPVKLCTTVTSLDNMTAILTLSQH